MQMSVTILMGRYSYCRTMIIHRRTSQGGERGLQLPPPPHLLSIEEFRAKGSLFGQTKTLKEINGTTAVKVKKRGGGAE